LGGPFQTLSSGPMTDIFRIINNTQGRKRGSS